MLKTPLCDLLGIDVPEETVMAVGRIPVVLVHGFLDNTAIWSDVESQLTSIRLDTARLLQFHATEVVAR